jgi:hypothetical protein
MGFDGRLLSGMSLFGSQASAITAIEIFRPGTRTGSFAPWRAGGSCS